MEVVMSGFEITQVEKEKVTILYLKGFLDAHTAPQFEKALQNLIKDNRVKIIVNMRELDYISSAGLGVIMGFIEEIREKEGDIKMSNLSDKVYRVFDLLGFPALYEIFEEEEEAESKFN
jgi:anti-sigma B factor antagonist